MLDRFISWFEIEPASALLPYDGWAMSKFVDLGALTPPRRTRQVLCHACGDQHPRQLPLWADPEVTCGTCGSKQVELISDHMSVQIRLPWLPSTFARLLSGPTAVPMELIPERLWRLTTTTTSAGRAPVYLLRSGWHIDQLGIKAVLGQEESARQILITSSLLLNDQISTSHRIVIPMDEAIRIETEGIQLNHRRLGTVVTAPLPLWFTLEPPYNRLILGGETLVLRRKQKRFMRLLKEKHAIGFPSFDWRELAEECKYSRQITSLSQIFSDEVRRFIDSGHGHVWIRKEAVPRVIDAPPNNVELQDDQSQID
ncbi:hypothetical protein [Lysobacter enzymogenes]|uniref:hypothetical protein n=1 Tax=Lysobacter enzymogenes TaxID=69 RepID=UPI001AF25BC8|nr:hypothetical protein [Lysobacter enzymogenes]QQQ01004.1 hypothetical protein JHW41_23540 [Lysobacter enzymogenes]